MIHEVFPVGPLQCNCSVIGDEGSREAMVVDPGENIEQIRQVLAKHGLTVKQIVITHGHIDHVSAAARLKQLTGAPVYMNKRDNEQLALLEDFARWIGVPTPERVEVDYSLEDGDLLTTGKLEASALHTPGHTEGSVCLHFPAERKLIAGDTLFAGSIGRTDLPGGSFEKIMRSLKGRLLRLPDETIVIPGHGDTTTIGEERESNPFLK